MAFGSQKMLAIRAIATKSISVIGGVSILGLTACASLEPDYIACPEVKALAGAENVMLSGKITGQQVTARFDGVSAKCIATPNGYDMDLGIALILRRDLNVYAKVEEVPIDLTIAYIDKNDEVVARSVRSFTGYLPTISSGSRPVFSIDDNIPAGTRVVLALGRTNN